MSRWTARYRSVGEQVGVSDGVARRLGHLADEDHRFLADEWWREQWVAAKAGPALLGQIGDHHAPFEEQQELDHQSVGVDEHAHNLRLLINSGIDDGDEGRPGCPRRSARMILRIVR